MIILLPKLKIFISVILLARIFKNPQHPAVFRVLCYYLDVRDVSKAHPETKDKIGSAIRIFTLLRVNRITNPPYLRTRDALTEHLE